MIEQFQFRVLYTYVVEWVGTSELLKLDPTGKESGRLLEDGVNSE